MNRLAAAFLIALSMLMTPIPASAVMPDEMLEDPALEARAREISKLLRCVVCQNQSIDDSNAELARDLRILVRERLVMGDSDREVLDYAVARYGDFVLLMPPFQTSTYVLWFGPPLIVLIGVIGMVMFYRRRRDDGDEPAAEDQTPQPLTAAERKRLEAILRDTETKDTGA